MTAPLPTVTPSPTTLPSIADVKAYLRIETQREDMLLVGLIAEAVGSIEGLVGKSLTTEDVTWYDDSTSLRSWGSPTNLILRYVPIDGSTVVVTDGSSDVVDAAQYQVRQDIGMIMGTGDLLSGGRFAFSNGPYVVACTAGFGTSPTYLTRELPMIRALVMDWVSYLYYQRTAGASSEGATGARVDYETDAEMGIPKRLAAGVRRLRGPVISR